MKRGLLLLAAISASAQFAGCAQETKIRQKVLGYVNRTEEAPREFVYKEQASGREITVNGRIEDSLRFQEALKIGGADVLEEVVDDDTLGIRVPDPARLAALTGGASLPGLNELVSEALLTGQWIVDPSGAPTLKKDTKQLELTTGVDPLEEAVEALRYVRSAIVAAADVKEWSKDDLLPAYRDFEDHFPPSDLEAGIRRFDLIRPVLPRPQQGFASGFQSMPRTANFRKMAIYVKGRSVVRVMEEIDIEGHFDFVEARREGKKRLLDLLDAIKRGQGQERIRPRKFSIEFTLGKIVVRGPAGLMTKIPGAESIGRLFGDTQFARGSTPQGASPAPAPPPSGG